MDFEQIEDAIVTALKAGLAYVQTVETYSGQLESDIDQMAINFPAAYVVYGNSQISWVDGPNLNELCEISVFVAAQDLRGNASARKDDNTGCYRLIKDVLATLTNKTFGLDISGIKPIRVTLVLAAKTMAIYCIDFQTNFDNYYGNW